MSVSEMLLIIVLALLQYIWWEKNLKQEAGLHG